MSRRGRRPRIVALAILCLVWLGLVCRAADPDPAAAVKKPDWAGLDALLLAGDYEQAAAAADELLAGDRPKRRDRDFLPRSIAVARALMRRGVAELRLGRLDAADATLMEASETLTDRDFQRLLSVEARAANARVLAELIQLDINLVELLDFRMAVILERLRLVAFELGDGPLAAEHETELRAQVGEWLDALDKLERNAGEARETLTKRLALAGTAVQTSPHGRAVAGRFRPALVAGMRSLELARFPFGDPRATPDEPAAAATAKPGRERLAESVKQFTAAAAALDEAIAAAAPKGVAALKPDARVEVILLRADLLVAEALALLEAGEPGKCRARLAEAMALRQEAATLLKLREPERHPDLFWPLLVSAESLLDDARRQLTADDAARSRTLSLEARQLLERADALPVPADHPLRRRLAHLQEGIRGTLAAVEAKIPGSDAADAAARKLRRAIDATAAAGVDY